MPVGEYGDPLTGVGGHRGCFQSLARSWTVKVDKENWAPTCTHCSLFPDCDYVEMSVHQLQVSQCPHRDGLYH